MSCEKLKYRCLIVTILAAFLQLNAAVVADKQVVLEPPAPDQKVEVKADQTSPAGAMLMFIRALESGDAEGAIAVTELRDDDDKEMLEAVASATMAHADLRKAIKVKFGDDSIDDTEQLKHLGLKTEYDFTDAEITIEDETATAKLRNNRGTIGLIKADEKWKVSIPLTMKSYTQKAKDISESFHKEENLALKSLQRLKADKYADLSQVQDDLDKMYKEIDEHAKKQKQESGNEK